jgi:hypothetical protein
VLRPSVTSAFVYRNAAGDFDAGVVSGNLDLELPTGAVARLSASRQEDDLLVPFAPTGETSVPAGRYAAHSTRLDFVPSTGPALVLGGWARAGQYFDGTLYSANLAPEWRASAHLRMSAELQVDRVEFPARGQRHWSRLARLRVFAAASPRLMLTTVIQASHESRLAQANARLRYNAAEGHDLWIVYGQIENLDRERVTPSLPGTARANVLVKYTRSFGT